MGTCVLFFLESFYCLLVATSTPLFVAYLGPGLAHIRTREGGRSSHGAAEAPCGTSWTMYMRAVCSLVCAMPVCSISPHCYYLAVVVLRFTVACDERGSSRQLAWLEQRICGTDREP